MPKPNKNSYKKLSSQDNLFSVADRLTTKNVYIDGITKEQLQDLRTMNANAAIRTFDKFINSLVSGEESWSGQGSCSEKLFQSVISDEDFLKKLQSTQYCSRL